MIWGDFIVYAMLALIALAGFVVNYHRKITMVVAFFIMSILLYGAVNVVYSVEEKFNPDLHDCIKWDCPTEKYGFNLFSVTQDDSECDYKTPEPYRVLGADVRHWSNRITFEGECISWQPKQQKRSGASNYAYVENIFIGGMDFPCLNLSEKECVEEERRIINDTIRYMEIVKNANDEAYCKYNPSDAEKCRCVRKVKTYTPVNETSGIILPAGTTSPLSGFAAGGCFYGEKSESVCSGFNYTFAIKCVEAVPR